MMRRIRLRGLIYVIFVCLAVSLGLTIHARADLAISETPLNPEGGAYEINPDSSGVLWVSDSDAGEVWGVNPGSGSYDIYPMGGYPIDARQADGYLWWADGLSDILGRVSTEDGSFTQWEIPDANGFYGTNFDAEGRFFAMDAFFPYLYRLDADSSELCKYTLPSGGMTDYVVREEGYLWMGDWVNGRILRLQVSDGNLTWWQLPEGSTPFGMAVDQPGDVWFIDLDQNAVVMLIPSTNQLRTFALPTGDDPKMIAIQSGFIWYTEDGLASIGRLDPLSASYTSETLSHDSLTLEPSCVPIDPSSTGTLEVSSGELNWSDSSLLTLVDADGWRIYQMPEDAYPWGITVPGLGYVVDSGRQQLVRFTSPTDTTLTVIKHVVNDSGGTAVAGDFTITVTNPHADPTSFPGAESPGTQLTLQPGVYSVTEQGPAGYSASYSEGCSGTITPGQSKTCTITNDDQQAYITVTKEVINNDSGEALPDDFLLTLSGNPVQSEVAVPVNPGTYTAGETLLPGYTCIGFSGDCNNEGQLTVALGESKTCTLTNDDISGYKIYLPMIIR